MHLNQSISGAVICLAGLLWTETALSDWLIGEQAIMGTSIRVELWSDDKKFGQNIISQIMTEMHRIDSLMSPYKSDSEITKINNEAGFHPVRVSQELLSLIEKSLVISKQTNGAFDITFASAGFMYDFRRKKRPSKASLKQVLPSINFRHIQINQSEQTIYFKNKGVKIDLGGIAKGYAVDRGISILVKHGIQHGIVTAGGDSRILGDRKGRPWFVGIRDPRNSQGLVARLPVRNEAISTSGDYEHFFEEDGVRYHHILNPKSGKSVQTTRSVTVIGPDATTTDALSTSLFVLGPRKAIKLANKLTEIEAVVIDGNGRMHYSSGLQNLAGAKH